MKALQFAKAALVQAVWVPGRMVGSPLLISTPMAHLIPVTDKKIELKHHLVSRDEWISIRNRHPTEKFYKSFYYRRKLLRKQEAEKSKCPFSKLMKR